MQNIFKNTLLVHHLATSFAVFLTSKNLERKNKDAHESDETDMSHHIRKPRTCMGKNKDADQLCSNSTADQCLSFHHTDSTIPLLLK